MNKMNHRTIDKVLIIIQAIKDMGGKANSREIRNEVKDKLKGNDIYIKKMISRAFYSGFIIRKNNFSKMNGYEYELPADSVIESLEIESRIAYDRMEKTSPVIKIGIVGKSSNMADAILRMGRMNCGY